MEGRALARQKNNRIHQVRLGHIPAANPTYPAGRSHAEVYPHPERLSIPSACSVS